MTFDELTPEFLSEVDPSDEDYEWIEVSFNEKDNEHQKWEYLEDWNCTTEQWNNESNGAMEQ